MRRTASNTTVPKNSTTFMNAYAPMQTLIGPHRDRESANPVGKMIPEKDGFLRKKVKTGKDEAINNKQFADEKGPSTAAALMNMNADLSLDIYPRKPSSASMERKIQKYLVIKNPEVHSLDANKHQMKPSVGVPQIQEKGSAIASKSPLKQIKVMGFRDPSFQKGTVDPFGFKQSTTNVGRVNPAFKIRSQSPAVKLDTTLSRIQSPSLKALNDSANKSDLKENTSESKRVPNTLAQQNKPTPFNLLRSRDFRSPLRVGNSSSQAKIDIQVKSKLNRSVSLADQQGMKIPRFTQVLQSRDSQSSSEMGISRTSTPSVSTVPDNSKNYQVEAPRLTSPTASATNKQDVANLKNFLVDPKSAGIEMSVTDFRKLDLQHHGRMGKELKGCLKTGNTSPSGSRTNSPDREGNQDSPANRSSKGTVSFSENVVLIIYQA